MDYVLIRFNRIDAARGADVVLPDGLERLLEEK